MTEAADTRRALEAALLDLEPRWTVVANLAARVGTEEARADYLLLHPARGIAIVNLTEPAQDPIASLRRFLDRQRWRDFLPGALPIVQIVAAGTGAASLRPSLDAAFGAAEPLGIADPDWPDAVTALVTAQQSPRAWLGSAPSAAAVAEATAETVGFVIPEAVVRPTWDAEPAEPDDEATKPPPASSGEAARTGGWPRWQTVIATVSLAIFGWLYLNLPEQPPLLSPVVEVAVDPAPVLSASVPEAQNSASAVAPAGPPPAVATQLSAKAARVNGAPVAVPIQTPPAVAPAPPVPAAAPSAPRASELPLLSPPKSVDSAAFLPSIPARPAPGIAKSAPHPLPNPIAKAAASTPPGPVRAQRPAAEIAKSAPPQHVAEPIANAAAIVPPRPAQVQQPASEVAKAVSRASKPDRTAALTTATTAATREAPVAALSPKQPRERGRRASTVPAANRQDAAVPHKQRTVAALVPAPRPRIETPPVEAIARERPVRKTEIADLIHRNCRRYSSRITVLGVAHEVAGLACQASDGSWQIVSEASSAAP